MTLKHLAWKILETKEIFKTGIFRFRVDKCELPNGKIMPNYYIFEFPDWVNVVPVTPEKKIVLIRQYRHANQSITIEIPGGSMHPNTSETPLDEAKRELIEETGYDSDEFILVMSHDPNPALQNNKMHTFLALNCIKKQEPQMDPFEDIETFEASLKEVQEMIKNGTIKHSLILASLMLGLEKIDSV